MRLSRLVSTAGWRFRIAALAITLPLAAQDPQPPQPFRAAVDLVPVDVSVFGDEGKPLLGLTDRDFFLTVDGRPRRIASAEYVSTVRGPKGPAAPSSADYSTNAGGGGRLILFVVDRGNIGAGRGRAALEAASHFISQLAPVDRIGLLAFPGTGTQIEFTNDHAQVQKALPGLLGQADAIQTNHRIDLAEAMAVQRGDLLALNTVSDRECGGGRLEDVQACKSQLTTEASALATLTAQRTQNTLVVLRALIDRLASTRTPKTIVFLSEGLVVDRLADVDWLGPSAARGQVTIHAVQLDARGGDMFGARNAVTPGRDLALAREGLSLLAGATRGELLSVAGGADNAFGRLAMALSGYYLLSFEPESVDRDGATHRIKVDVPGKSGVHVRARSEFSIGRVVAKTDETILTDLLQAPALVSDIGLKLTAFTLRDIATPKLRILMAVEIDRAANPDGRVALAFALSDERGQIITSQIDQEVKAPVRQNSTTQTYTNFILTETAGPVVLKVAVVDDMGRQGSVEHRFRPALTTVGQFQATDLLIADERAAGGTATPAIGREFTSGMVNGYIELYSDTPGLLQTTSVIFEVAQNEQARALDGAAGKVQAASAETPNRQAIEGVVPTMLLPPGEYVIRAVVNSDGRRIGQIVRPFRVGRPVTPSRSNTSLSLKSAGSRSTPVPFSSRIDRFERASVLTPQVVGFFLERMNFAAQGESNPAPVMEHARAGRFDEAVEALRTKTGTLASAFLTGLALYSKGQLEPAAAKFREALRLDSEFLPAAFYLGSCYAAGGRDSEAVGAWQLSLVSQGDAPFIYTLLGDALLRQRDVNQALDVLNEAASLWPDDDEVQVRIGSALALAGKRGEALLKFEPYLERNPQDHERHFAALRILYEAKVDGRPVRSTTEDRALFEKWAAAYAAAQGPQQALVDQWQRVVVK
jgi:VWFA-related protein